MLVALVCVHDDNEFLAATLSSLGGIPALVAVSRCDWQGQIGAWEASKAIAESLGAEVVLGDWPNESEHRQAALRAAHERGFRYAITADSDEVLEPELLSHLKQIAATSLADRVYIEWNTYWKDPVHVVRPREPFTPCIMVNLDTVRHVAVREYIGGRGLFLNSSFGIVHHLSYAGSDQRIWKKITTWSHKDEIVQGWWQNVWKGWDSNPLMRNLHPTNPPNYQFVERIELPAVLASAGLTDPSEPFDLPEVAPCSIVIPVYGNQADLDECLASLQTCGELVKEIVVVDDCSPEKITVPKGVTLIRNKANLGFSGTCNAGYAKTSGGVVVFLNSDTIVPKAGLAMLLNSLEQSGSIVAAGPFTNNAGHFQQIDPTYTEIANLDRFAEAFASLEQEDRDIDMLVGFCLAVKRSVLEEVGLFDERFGKGTYEDNDLSYRIRRAGYRIVLSERSFIHHKGSKSLLGAGLEIGALLNENQRIYVNKWKRDLDSGFASNLSGLSGEPIAFHWDRKPEAQLKELAKLAKKADISLCMIVRNEERTLKECLESVKPFVREMRILDTGSTDRTVEIAESCGAIVDSMVWPDSFAEARTRSMKGAKGKWIIWVDADDTLPFQCGETILSAVASAPEDIIGFVVPVKFVEERGNGTVVDHVKVFRNLPGLEWEGRIHEQILGALRRAKPNGAIARLDAWVLHSGYDTSESGQEKKRHRDSTLLRLDLEDRPGHPFVLFNLGMTAHYNGEHAEAVDWLRKSILASGENESHLRKAFALLVGSLKSLALVDDARIECERGLAMIPNDPELLFLLAGLNANAGSHEEAIRLYQASLKGDTGGAFTSMDPGIRGWKTLHNVALSHLALGDWASARSAWKAAMEGEGRLEAASALFSSSLDHGDLRGAKEVLDWVLAHQGDAGMWPGMAGALCDATGLSAAAQWQAAVERNYRNDEARRLLAVWLLNHGREQEAVPHLDLLHRRGHAVGATLMAQLAANHGDNVKAEAWMQRARALGWKCQ